MSSRSSVVHLGLLPLTVVCVLLTGCEGDAAPPSVKDGFAKYMARQVDESESIADRYIAANPNAANLDEAYYLRGLSRMARGNRVGAAADLHEAIVRTARADLKTKAYRALGDMAFEQAKWGEAQKNFEAAIAAGASPAAGVTFMNYRVGESLQAQGDWTRAVAWFAKVVAADNDAALKARSIARMHKTGFSLQFGAFAEAAGARDLAAKLNGAGIATTIPVDVAGGKLLYLVQSGMYSTWAEAAAARDQMIAKSSLPVAIVP